MQAIRAMQEEREMMQMGREIQAMREMQEDREKDEEKRRMRIYRCRSRGR